MPGGTNAPKLCPAEPWKRRRIVSSGSPAAPHFRVTALPSIVPTTRLPFWIGSVAVTGVPPSIAGRQSGMSWRFERQAGTSHSLHFTCPTTPRFLLFPFAVAGGLRGNLLQAARSVVAAHGPGALYKGFRASLIGDVLGNALGFTAYEIGNR